jgi:hypothetical protein
MPGPSCMIPEDQRILLRTHLGPGLRDQDGSADGLSTAIVVVVEHEARRHLTPLPLAQAWGGGEMASADGMRFVIPVSTVNAAYKAFRRPGAADRKGGHADRARAQRRPDDRRHRSGRHRRARYAGEFLSELWELAHTGASWRAQVAYAARQAGSAVRLRAALRGPARRAAAP